MIEGVFHAGLQSSDPERLAAYYEQALGMTRVGGSTDGPAGVSVFLRGDSRGEEHHLAIFSIPFAHHAFRVSSLADLRAAGQRVVAAGGEITRSLNHGASFALYTRDPDSNLVEIYWPTGRSCPQPYAEPLDLSLSDEELLAGLERWPRV